MLPKVILLVKKLDFFLFSFLLIYGLVHVSCTSPDKRVITVACASNLQFVMPVLINEYLKLNPNVTIEVSFGSSGKLTSQIREGAPFNIFLAANTEYPEKLFRDGFARSSPNVYACGKLILFKQKGRLDINNFKEELSSPKNLVAMPNPDLAPYGKAAVQFLDNFDIKISDKRIVSADNISSSVHYSLTCADLGFISCSAMYSEELKKYKNSTSYIILPEHSYDPIRQGLVILDYGIFQEEIDSFITFLFSEFGQNIFISYGYARVETYAVH